MYAAKVNPGDDVEAWCTRCRMNLNHRVIAVVGSAIQRVHCLTCGGDHKYYPPKNTNGPSQVILDVVADVLKAPKSKKTTDRAVEKARGEWSSFMNNMPSGSLVRSYSIREPYSAGEYIEHPEFGTGKVLAILGSERMEVIFQAGRKVMVCNRKP